MSLVLTTAGLQRMLANAITEGEDPTNPGWLFGSRAILFTGSPILNKDTVYATLEQPTFTGYAISALTWAGAYQDGQGTVWCSAGLKTFAASATPDPTVTITGWGIITPTGETPIVLLAAEMFGTPINLVSTSSVVAFVPELRLAAQPNYGGAVQIPT